MTNELFLGVHNDDEILFGSFTLIHNKPLVAIVTDSWIQPNRGERGCSADERWEETKKATAVLGCSCIRLGIRDDALTEEALVAAFRKLAGFSIVYAPAVQGGNWQHDLVGKVAKDVFGSIVKQYTTYTKTELWTKGETEIIPSREDLNLKFKALICYQSQFNLPSTRPHFEAVMGKSEWLI